VHHIKIDGMPVVRISQIVAALAEKGVTITYGSIRWAVLSGKLQHARFYPKQETREIYIRYLAAVDFVESYRPQKAGRKRKQRG